MGKISCFSCLLGGGNKTKKRSKVRRGKVAYAKKGAGNDCQKVKPVEFMDMADTVASVPAHTPAVSPRQERDRDANQGKGEAPSDAGGYTGKNAVSSPGERGAGGHTGKNAMASPGEPDARGCASTSPPAASPRLKRSCSNIEAPRSVLAGEFDDLPPGKSRSHGDLTKTLPSICVFTTTTPSGGAPDAASSPASVRSSRSADRVMLRKRSSRQVLPSRSSRLWWQLLLWSHSNPHRPRAVPPLPPSSPADACGAAARENDGYTSDTLDAATAREPKNKEVAVEEGPIILPDQSVAFSAEATSSALDRVSAWVNSIGTGSSFNVLDDDEEEDDVAAVRASCSAEIVECSTPAVEKQARAKRHAAVQAGSIAQTLNAVASVANISAMGLQAVPMIAAFSSLRAVNLSGNFIAHIQPGSLPKGLHSLDLSRNKIASIEGLRELTRLRVLNLSYNRIARIGHGLSGCTAIRELYLVGNKISGVEGLHRLLKLAVLDVSFNRVTTATSLGQLVANYGSLRALNLLGNPVQANVGDDALRKAVAGLLPRLEYLNKQAVKPQRAREVAKGSVAQAAHGNGAGWGARGRRTAARRVILSQSPGSSAKSRGRDGGGSSLRRGSRSRSVIRAPGSSVVSRR